MPALFASPAMATVSIIVLLFEGLSLAFLVLCIVEFRILMRRHAAFFHGIGNGEHERVMRRSRLFLRVYVIMTIIVTVTTSYIFLFQPHIL